MRNPLSAVGIDIPETTSADYGWFDKDVGPGNWQVAPDSLVQVSDGIFFGTTAGGGTYNTSTLF